MATPLAEINDEEKEYLMRWLRLFKKDCEARHSFIKGFRKHERDILEQVMESDLRLLNYYDHCMRHLSYNNLSSFIAESDYFKPLIKGFNIK